jgi:hypothetical protein
MMDKLVRMTLSNWKHSCFILVPELNPVKLRDDKREPLAPSQLPLYFKLRFDYKDSLFRQSYFLLLLYFFITFFLSNNISTAPRTTRTRYNALQRRMQGNSLLLTILSIFFLSWLTFAFCITATLILGISYKTATYIGLLTPGHDGHGLDRDWDQGITKSLQFF